MKLQGLCSVPLPIVDASTPPTGVTVCVSDLVGAIFSRHAASDVAGNATLAHVNFGFQGCNWPIIEHLLRVTELHRELDSSLIQSRSGSQAEVRKSETVKRISAYIQQYKHLGS